MKRTVIAAVVLMPVLVVVLLLAAGRVATAPANRPIGAAPADLPVKAVEIIDRHQRTVSGWRMTGARQMPAVLLVHGIRSTRRSMLGRARLLFNNGYSVLLIDLQAHGESSGDRLTFGYREADSVVAATRYARKLWPDRQLAIIGTSLGGAAAVFAANRQRADAYVLEAVYSSLQQATENRLRIRLGSAGAALAPLLLWQTPLQLGFHADELSPVDRIGELKAPLLLIAGEKDERTTLADSKALYSRANAPKELWVVSEARHQDFHRFDEVAYSRRVLSFLDRQLNQGAR